MRRRIDEETTNRARSLRKEMTDAERLLWKTLRDERMKGFRFRRQHPIGRYIVDFVCLECKIIVELDGGQHQEQIQYDEVRTAYLEAQGWKVLRFWNNEIFGNEAAVLSNIADSLTAHPHPNPPPDMGGEKTDRDLREKRRGSVISLKARALRYLSAREHSRAELAKKLARHAAEGDDVEALLDQLEAARFLSDERFSESLVHRRAARFGNGRILRELQQHDIDADKMADIKASLAQDEPARALEVWRKKFNQPPANAAERAKQIRFLQQRGFSHRAIQAALRFDGEENG